MYYEFYFSSYGLVYVGVQGVRFVNSSFIKCMIYGLHAPRADHQRKQGDG